MHLPDATAKRIAHHLIEANNRPPAFAHCQPGQLLTHGLKSTITGIIYKAAQQPDGSPVTTIALELTQDEAHTLAQFLKRVRYDTAEEYCDQPSERPSDLMDTFAKLRRTLADQGHSPR
jgi:hypothetical protein